MAYKFKIEEWRHPSGDTWFRLSVLRGRWPFRHWQRVDSYSSENQAGGGHESRGSSRSPSASPPSGMTRKGSKTSHGNVQSYRRFR